MSAKVNLLSAIALLIGNLPAFTQGDFTDSPDEHLIEIVTLPSTVRSDFPSDDEHFIVPEPVYLESMSRPAIPLYDRLYQAAGASQLIFVEADPEVKVCQVHVMNSLGFEILCFPTVTYNKNNMVRLDLSPLKPGYYQLLMEGNKTLTRDISIGESNQVIYLK
jgi:hypothetical protein